MRSNQALSSVLAVVGLLFPIVGEKLFGKRVAIVVANLVPLIGLWFLDWTLVELFFYFILEITILFSFHMLSVTIGPFAWFRQKLQKRPLWQRFFLVPLSWIPAIFLAQVPFFVGVQFVWGIVFLHEYLVRGVAKATGTTAEHEAILDSLSRADLGSAFWESPFFFILFTAAISFFFFWRQNHAKNYVIAFGEPSAMSFATYMFASWTTVIDRLPLIILVFASAFITLHVIAIFPAIVGIVVIIKMSIELYLNQNNPEAVDPRVSGWVERAGAFKDRLLYGYFFGYKRKLEWEDKAIT